MFITEVDANRDAIELSNGDVVVAGQLADRDVAEETERRIQIREVVRAHLDKERELFSQGIKVLSLFFIDEVAKYRDYSRQDAFGDYARMFEEEYAAIRDEVLGELAIDAATEEYQHLPAPRRRAPGARGLLLHRQEDQAPDRRQGLRPGRRQGPVH
ncbi:hypothetical protein [Propioniciclava flava]